MIDLQLNCLSLWPHHEDKTTNKILFNAQKHFVSTTQQTYQLFEIVIKCFVGPQFFFFIVIVNYIKILWTWERRNELPTSKTFNNQVAIIQFKDQYRQEERQFNLFECSSFIWWHEKIKMLICMRKKCAYIICWFHIQNQVPLEMWNNWEDLGYKKGLGKVTTKAFKVAHNEEQKSKQSEKTLARSLKGWHWLLSC